MQRADDPAGDRAALQRARDRDQGLPAYHRRRIAERQRRQAADLVDLQDRDGGLAVVVDQPRLVELGVARDQDGDAARAGDHVHVGDDVAVAGHEVARSRLKLRLLLRDQADHRGLGAGGGLDDRRVL